MPEFCSSLRMMQVQACGCAGQTDGEQEQVVAYVVPPALGSVQQARDLALGREVLGAIVLIGSTVRSRRCALLYTLLFRHIRQHGRQSVTVIAILLFHNHF